MTFDTNTTAMLDRPTSLLSNVSPLQSPVIPPERLKALAAELLGYSAADTMIVQLTHRAVGAARVARSRVRLNNSGDSLEIKLYTRFGGRASAMLDINQLEPATLRQAVQYLDTLARDQEGDPAPTDMPIPPRTYLPNTTWHDSTASAFFDARHGVIPALINPLLNANVTASAFAGVYAHSYAYADKQGLAAAGEETDNELIVTGWNANGKGSGWAGQAVRDWTKVDPDAVAQRALRLTQMSLNPMALEPGRYTAILDRPAVAQIVRGMGGAFDAAETIRGGTPMYDRVTSQTRIGKKVFDERVSLRSDPNDPDGGYLPFNGSAYPVIPMMWVENGIGRNLAFTTNYAAKVGVVPANDDPVSLRLTGTNASATVEDMIARCERGIYVNRFAHVRGLDPNSGTVTGVTNGGCFLVKNGKIEKPIKDFRFVESPWFFLNRLIEIGVSERTAFGYSPWYGSWPIAPTIVPPLMVREFNFTALADAV